MEEIMSMICEDLNGECKTDQTSCMDDNFVESPSDLKLLSIPEHRRYYASILDKYLGPDPTSIIVDFLVWGYLRPGDFVDVLYLDGKWYAGLVVNEGVNQFGQQMIFVHYIGWQPKWREWLNKQSRKVQPGGLMTKNRIEIGGSLQHFGTEDTAICDLKPGDRVVFNKLFGEVTKVRREVEEPHVLIQIGDETQRIGLEEDGMIRKMVTGRNWCCTECKFVNAKNTFFCVKCGYCYYSNMNSFMKQ